MGNPCKETRVLSGVHKRIYKYLGGRQRPLSPFSGASTIKKMLGVSPSMRFFGVGASHARFLASRSRPELASARP